MTELDFIWLIWFCCPEDGVTKKRYLARKLLWQAAFRRIDGRG